MKAQGLPISVIVIAALAVIVLFILSAILIARTGIFAKAVGKCPGECVEERECDLAKGDINLGGSLINPNTNKPCEDEGKICCKKAV